jgi:chromosome segregation ATPase
LETNLALRKRVEVHEVEERKNQHINDLKHNHKNAFKQMKAYYNDITGGNLQVIKDLQKKIVELKEQAINNKQKLLEYTQLNQKLSAPLAEATAEIAELQALLRERTKDQMALRNAHSRLAAIGKSSVDLRREQEALELEYSEVEKERDQLYSSFSESIERVQQQSEFHNQALGQRLKAAEASAQKASMQVQEIIRAANLDGAEMTRIMETLNQMLAAKDEALKNVRFLVIKLKKTYNDSLATFQAKLKDLGVPEQELLEMGFTDEDLPHESTGAPAGLIYQTVS